MNHSIQGQCHCGSIQLHFQASQPLSELPTRECQCSFCRKHSSRNVSDPNGQVSISVQTKNNLIRYQFGQKTADFFICATCGVYVAAVMEDQFSTLNIYIFPDAEKIFSPPVPVSYDSEDSDSRVERRKQRWTPTTIG